MNKDIFISYKNDGEGNNFAARLYDDLSKKGYSVYFNSHEQKSGSFPERLKEAVLSCKDFIIILSEGCLAQLKSHNDIDWIREELLTAKYANKNIVPVLIGVATMPSNKKEMPEDLQFLPDLEACYLPEQYINSPFSMFLEKIDSVPETFQA